jgi:hypothetical protein
MVSLAMRGLRNRSVTNPGAITSLWVITQSSVELNRFIDVEEAQEEEVVVVE